MFWLLNRRLRTHRDTPNLHRWQYTQQPHGYDLTVHGVLNGLLWRIGLQLVTDYSFGPNDGISMTRKLRMERLHHG